MSLLLSLSPVRPRRPRSFRPEPADVPLEVRALLAAAVIQWSMDPRFVNDPLHGNAPDLVNTYDYANPANGYGVSLDASQSSGILPTTTFLWTVTSSSGLSLVVSGENPDVDLQQGSYRVKLTATGLAGTRRPVSTVTTILVKDVLVVSIGDSYASGEGNPVVPGFFDPEWAYSPDAAMNQENADAHRSTLAGPAQFALQLEASNPHQSVTFVSVANSGATIPEGVLGPMPSIGDPSHILPAEIDELKSIIGTRHIDVLAITVGADDVGFSERVKQLIENTYFGYPTLTEIQQQYNADIQALPGQYANLAKAVQALNPGQVMIAPYPDVTRDQNGNVAAILGPLDVTLVSKANAEFASSTMIPPLNAAVAAAAKTYKWTYLSQVFGDFNTHGYPSTSPWIRTLTESEEMEGTDQGTFHPNATGHLDIARRMYQAYRPLMSRFPAARGLTMRATRAARA
ncbi:SGNH/GDSL hydrolase family protein [Paludisphaera rhizosphaerae]|uniref:GDSL-type esterase/lipase family protein n=1 Tax=Paludisphaera rhizosphaerae TaxID=2711216 RepID=UPI0013EB02D3|nr:GDSL-type esterase/lipase family protein [Paludisphaera rhizosphaerae]